MGKPLFIFMQLRKIQAGNIMAAQDKTLNR